MIKKVFPVLALSIFSSMLGVGIVAPLLPLYAEKMGATGIWIGTIFAAFSISRAIVMPIVGKLSDRSGRKVFLAVGLFTYAIISLGYIWAGNPFQLTLVRLIQGIAAGMVIPIAQAYVGDISPEAEEGKWQGYFNAAFFSGFGFGPLMGGALTDHFGMKVAFFTMSGLNLLGFLMVIFFLPDAVPKEIRDQSRPSFRKILRSNIIKGLLCFRLAFAVGRGAFAGFLPIFAGIYIGLTPTRIGILIAANILVMSFFQPFGGRISDVANRRFLVIAGSIINIAFLSLISSGTNFWQLFGVCALGSLGGGISVPAASALLVEEGRNFGMGSTMAIFGMAFSIGMAIGPLLGGVIVDTINIRSVFYFGAGISILGMSLFIWHTREQENSSV